ncbi:hypothetical protein ACFJ3O_005042, partial [Escherichia coli]
SPVKKILFIKFGDMCHAFTRQLSIALNKSSKPAYSSKNYLCVIFPQHRDANVHIAAILFFDYVERRMQIRTQHFKRQDWVNGKGIAGERQD